MNDSRMFMYPSTMHWLTKYIAGPVMLVCGTFLVAVSLVNLVQILAGRYPAEMGHLGLFLLALILGIAGGAAITSYPNLRIESNGLSIQIAGPIWLTVEWARIKEIRRLSPDVRWDDRLRLYRVQHYVIGVDRYLTPWHSVKAGFYSDDWAAAVGVSEDIKDVDALLAVICERSGLVIT